FFGGVGHRLGRALAPPLHRLLPRVTAVLKTDPLRFEVVQADLVINAHALRRIRTGATLRVQAELDAAHVVLRDCDLARENAGGGCLALMRHSLWWRKLIATIGTVRIARSDHRLALGASLGWRPAVAGNLRLWCANLVHGSMPKDIAAKVQDETCLFAG